MESLAKRESLKEALAWVLVIIQFADTMYVNSDLFHRNEGVPDPCDSHQQGVKHHFFSHCIYRWLIGSLGSFKAPGSGLVGRGGPVGGF